MCQMQKKEELTGTSVFSAELLLHIFSFLDAEDLCRCAQVCNSWFQITDDNSLWKELCAKMDFPVQNINHIAKEFKRHYPDSPQALVIASEGPTWIGKWKNAFQWFYLSKHRIFKEGEIKNGFGSFTWAFNPTVAFSTVLRTVQQLDAFLSQKKLQISCTYEGEWRDDMPHGLGRKVWSDGASFVGFWDNGKFHGFGTHSWASGNKYEGMWKNHMRNGHGSNTWPQKDCYEGEWLDDQKDGYGVYRWPDGRRYEGFWKKDKRNGLGTYYWSRLGCKYTGNWEDDRRQGFGRFYWNDSDLFEGEWHNGRRKGEGKFYCKSTGKVYLQVWDEKEFDAKNKGDLSRELKVADVPPNHKRSLLDGTEQGEDEHLSELQAKKKPKCPTTTAPEIVAQS